MSKIIVLINNVLILGFIIYTILFTGIYIIFTIFFFLIYNNFYTKMIFSFYNNKQIYSIQDLLLLDYLQKFVISLYTK